MDGLIADPFMHAMRDAVAFQMKNRTNGKYAQTNDRKINNDLQFAFKISLTKSVNIHPLVSSSRIY